MLRVASITLTISVCVVLAYVARTQEASGDEVKCFIWVSPPVPACPGCEDVNNCGDCTLAGVCGAEVWQMCAYTQFSSRVTEGQKKKTEYVPCFKQYECTCPNRGQPCRNSGIPAGDSEEYNYAERPGAPCSE